MVMVCQILHACAFAQKNIYCIPSSERVSRVLLMLGDEQREVASMGEGNIAVAVGMKNVSSISAW